MENNDNSKKIDILVAHAMGTNSRLDSIDANLYEHMKRSAAVEERQDLIEDRVVPLIEEHQKLIESQVKPLLVHFEGLKWSLGALTIVTAVVKILDMLKH